MSAIEAEHRYAHLTWEQAKDAAKADSIVVIPIGAIEQHGPHLPLDVDIHFATAVADRIGANSDDVLVAPPVSWGLSGAHMGFAGTLSLSPDTMKALLEDIAESLIHHGFRKIVFLVAHNSNRPLVSIVARELGQRHGLSLLVVFSTDFAAEEFGASRISPLGGELHAGELETAVELHLRPELVKMDRAIAAPVDAKAQLGMSSAASDMYGRSLVQIGFDLAECAPSGVMGDPTVSTPEVGERAFEAMVEGISAAIKEYGEL